MLNRNLIEIDLSGNKISQLPEEVCTLALLKELNLSSNKIKELPFDLGYLN